MIFFYRVAIKTSKPNMESYKTVIRNRYTYKGIAIIQTLYDIHKRIYIEMLLSFCGFGVSSYVGLRAKMQRFLSELSRAGEKAKESMYTTLTKLHESMTVSQSQSHPSTNFLIT